MQFYLALNRNYDLEPYLTLITDTNLRTTLTKYRLSEHSLAREVGRLRQTWLPKDKQTVPPLRTRNSRDRAALPDTVHTIRGH